MVFFLCSLDRAGSTSSPRSPYAWINSSLSIISELFKTARGDRPPIYKRAEGQKIALAEKILKRGGLSPVLPEKFSACPQVFPFVAIPFAMWFLEKSLADPVSPPVGGSRSRAMVVAAFLPDGEYYTKISVRNH